MRPRSRGTALVMLALPVLAAGCYSLAEPSLRPGDSRDLLAALTRRGVVVSEIVPGETACDDRGLVENALHLRAAAGADQEPRDVFIHLFRVRGWEDSAAAVDACQASYAARVQGEEVVRVDVPTYRAFGAGWSDALTAAVREALEEASTQGP